MSLLAVSLHKIEHNKGQPKNKIVLCYVMHSKSFLMWPRATRGAMGKTCTIWPAQLSAMGQGL